MENRAIAPWPAGRRDLHWHLLPKTVADREALAGPYRELARQPGLEPVDDEWLHVTVLHCGPHQDATAGEIQEIATRVREAVAGGGPVELTFARPQVGSVALERAARPGVATRRLWDVTRTATTEVVGERWPLQPAAAYYPHVSLAYAGSQASLADRGVLKQLLSDIDAGEVTLVFSSLSLVSQWHDGRRIVWDSLVTVPLVE